MIYIHIYIYIYPCIYIYIYIYIWHKFSSVLIKFEKKTKKMMHKLFAVVMLLLLVILHHLVLFRWLQQLNEINRVCGFMMLQVFDVMKITFIYVSPRSRWALAQCNFGLNLFGENGNIIRFPFPQVQNCSSRLSCCEFPCQMFSIYTNLGS